MAVRCGFGAPWAVKADNEIFGRVLGSRRNGKVDVLCQQAENLFDFPKVGTEDADRKKKRELATVS